MYRVRLPSPAMGVHLFKRTQQLQLLFLCFVFMNNISVSLMFSVSSHVDVDLYDSELAPADDDLADDYDFDQPVHFEEHELDTIKKTMIEGLGFRKVPDVTKMNVSQEEYARMYDVYLKRLEQRKMEDDDGDESSYTQSVPKFYTFHQKERHVRRKRRRGVTQLVFNISSNWDATAVDHSTLRLLAAASDRDGPVLVQVYQILGRQRTRLIDEKEIHLVMGAPKWCDFDVTAAVRSWVEDNDRNLGMELHCAECVRRGHGILVDNHLQRENAPVINALMTVGSSVVGRDKRSAEQLLFYEKNRRTDCHNKNSKRCCRHKMDVDVTQLGMDFIIQPKKFDGGICKGRCPPHYNAAHNHAILQSLMWKQNKNLTPRVCCAPSKLHHLEILTVDQDDSAKLAVVRWENMVVLECACS